MQITVSPDTFIYICFYFLLGRRTCELMIRRWTRPYVISVYCNSLLATLNVRKAIRGRGHGDLGISLRPIEDSNSSTAENRKVVGLVCLSFFTVADKSLAQETDIKAGIADVEAHGGHGGSSFVQSMSHNNNSQVAETESEFESGRAGHLRRASSF